MKQFVQNEEAVSPVIGVILMVAITVILAAVIAAFVFGMTGSVQSTKTVAATAAINNSGGLEVTLQGGADFAALNNVTVRVNGANVSHSSTPYVGEVLYDGTNAKVTLGSTKVIVSAFFNDGTQQVLLDKNF